MPPFHCSGHVRSTWNELINSDHQPRRGQYEPDGGRQRGRRGATRNFQINRPPVINKFWLLVMFALAWLFVASDAATPSTEFGMHVGTISSSAMGLAGMEYSNASIARTIETLLDSGASRIMLHDKDLFTYLRKAQYFCKFNMQMVSSTIAGTRVKQSFQSEMH